MPKPPGPTPGGGGTIKKIASKNATRLSVTHPTGPTVTLTPKATTKVTMGGDVTGTSTASAVAHLSHLTPVVIGSNATASSGSVAVGKNAISKTGITGQTSVVLGNTATNHHTSNVVIGKSASAITGSNAPNSSVVIGMSAAAHSNNIVAIGVGVTVSGSGGFAIGVSNTGTAASSTTQNVGVLGTIHHIIQIPGGVRYHTVIKSANYVATNTDYCILVTHATAVTITVPVPVTGQVLIVKRIGAGAVKILHNGTAKIDGHTTISLATQYEAVTMIATSAQWYITGQVATTIL